MENWLNNVKDWLDRKENKNNTDKYFAIIFAIVYFAILIYIMILNQNGM